jgi:hypothetical protein
VAQVAERIARRIERLMIRCGMTEKDEEFSNKQPLLAELYGASVSGRIATGPKTGRHLTKVGDDIDLEEIGVISSPRCASVSGVNVHANVLIPAHDRIRLERLSRYAGRPPVATNRLSGLPDGRLLYRLKRRWRDGTTHVIYESLEFMEKLAALVPPPRFNLIRYCGVLAPSSIWRRQIIPARPAEDSADFHCCKPAIQHAANTGKANKNPGIDERRYAWAELLKRVYSLDALMWSLRRKNAHPLRHTPARCHSKNPGLSRHPFQTASQASLKLRPASNIPCRLGKRSRGIHQLTDFRFLA